MAPSICRFLIVLVQFQSTCIPPGLGCRIWHVHTRDIFLLKLLHTRYTWVWHIRSVCTRPITVLGVSYYTNCPNLNCTRQQIGQCTPKIVGAHRQTRSLRPLVDFILCCLLVWVSKFVVTIIIFVAIYFNCIGGFL